MSQISSAKKMQFPPRRFGRCLVSPQGKINVSFGERLYRVNCNTRQVIDITKLCDDHQSDIMVEEIPEYQQVSRWVYNLLCIFWANNGCDGAVLKIPAQQFKLPPLYNPKHARIFAKKIGGGRVVVMVFVLGDDAMKSLVFQLDKDGKATPCNGSKGQQHSIKRLDKDKSWRKSNLAEPAFVSILQLLRSEHIEDAVAA